MSNFKLHEAHHFKLLKKLEKMDEIASPSFGTLSNTTDCEYEDNFNYYSEIDVKKLIRNLSSSYFKKEKFNAENYIIDKNFREEALKNSQKVKDNFNLAKDKIHFKKAPFLLDEFSKEMEDVYYKNLSKRIALNTTKCYLDNHVRENGYDIQIDISNKTISYSYTIHFKGADKHPAILLKTRNENLLFFFLQKIYGKQEVNNLKEAILKEFIKILSEKRYFQKIKPLVFLYDNLPNYIKKAISEKEKGEKSYKIPDALLWEHFMDFVQYDVGNRDASYYVIYLMTLMTPKYCIKKFRKDQRLVIEVYDGLDDRSSFDKLVRDYEYSETFSIGKNTLESSNKDVFVTLLNSYIQLHEKDADIAIFEPSGAHFHQGIHNVNPYASYGRKHKATYWLHTDTKRDKIYILNRWESYKGLGYALAKDGRSVQQYSFTKGYNEEGYYNPLDIVKFTQYNSKGEPITTNVPVILVYHAKYVKKWERINQGMRLGMNVLMIVVGVATIYSGVGSLMLYATLADIGLATTDIIIQGEADLARKDFRGDAGKKFLASWDQIYTYVGLATFSPVALNAVKTVAIHGPKMVAAGADLLQVSGKRVVKEAAYEKVKEFTLKAIHSLEIPNFNKTGMQILQRGADSIPEIKKAAKLQDVGVIFVAGSDDTVAAIYRGVPIASGKPKDVSRHLREAFDIKGKTNLKKHLDELVAEVEEKAISFNFARQISKQLGDELDISVLPQIVARIRRTTFYKNFDIIVVDRNNYKYRRLFQIWQDNPRSYGFFVRSKKARLRDYNNVIVDGPKIYLFSGEVIGEILTLNKHTLQHELFHVEMHAKLIDQLGMKRYLILDAKIPTHIREEYVVHRLLNSGGKAVEAKEIGREINLINKEYRPNAGINKSLTKDYLKNRWNLKNELKKIGITY